MNSNENERELAHQLSQDVNEALNRKIEERFRNTLFLVDPNLNMEHVTVISKVENDNELSVDGVDDETIDKAMAIFNEDE